MNWNYKCPKCNEWREIEWSKKDDSYKCHKTKQMYDPPTPSEQPNAYVDTHEWPKEMGTVVINIKGKKCTVPGCKKDYETLDHRIAFAKGGKTSVSNLFPMCEEHNLSKGDKDYLTWLNESFPK